MSNTNKAEQRLDKLVELIWKSRWVSDESDYMDLVGMAAEIRSGNFDGIDKAIAGGPDKAAADAPLILECPDCAAKLQLCARLKFIRHV